jgi:hypothetical protein
MLTEDIRRAMHKAHCEMMENGRHFGRFPGWEGVGAQAKTLESGRNALPSTSCPSSLESTSIELQQSVRPGR